MLFPTVALFTVVALAAPPTHPLTPRQSRECTVGISLHFGVPGGPLSVASGRAEFNKLANTEWARPANGISMFNSATCVDIATLECRGYLDTDGFVPGTRAFNSSNLEANPVWFFDESGELEERDINSVLCYVAVGEGV